MTQTTFRTSWNVYIAMVRRLLGILFLLCAANLLGQGVYRFVENNGQWPENVHHRCKIEIGHLYFESDAITFHLVDRSEVYALHGQPDFDQTIKDNPPRIYGHAYRQSFIGANKQCEITSVIRTDTRHNFFLGNNPDKWGANCKEATEIIYHDIYPGIDLRAYSNDFFLKYDFIVRPGADPAQIKWRYDGGVTASLAGGRLIVENEIEDIIEQKPICYSLNEGVKTPVSGHFNLRNGEVSFEFPDGHDQSKTLIIDPELIFSTYSGSFSDNFGYTATYDQQGFLYSGSSVFGDSYPVTLGAYQQNWAGGDGAGSLPGTDIAISKYDTTGTFMVWSSYLGGSSDELPHSLVVDQNDELIVLGTTSSDDFPFTNNAYDQSFGGGFDFAPSGVGVDYINGSDIIISRFSSEGDALVGSTFLGGTHNDGINQSSGLKFNYADEMRGEVEIASNGDVVVASCTFSDDFPIVDGFQDQHGGNLDGCVCRFNPDLSTLLWSTFIGGTDDDAAYALAPDNEDWIVCGGTESTGFLPNTGYQSQNMGGDADGFLIRISGDDQQISNSTYLGSPWYDQVYFVELDGQGNIYGYGQTRADGDYFINNAAYGNEDSGMLVAKFDSNLQELVWSTTIGTGSGKPNLSPTAFLVDICGKIYISGWGGTTNVNSNPQTDLVTGLPTTDDAYQSTTNASDFYLMVLDADATDVVYATFFGGAQSAEHVDGGTSRFNPQGEIYQSVCAGCGSNDDFPIYPANAVSPTNNSPNCNNGVFKFKFELPPVDAGFVIEDALCTFQPIQFINQSTSAPSYLWDFGDGDTSTETSPFHVYTEPGTYTVELFAENINCAFSDVATMEIAIGGFDAGDVNATASPVFIQEGESSQLNATPSGYTYSWSPTGSLDNPNVQNPLATPETTTTYTVEISDGDCSYPDTVRVIVQEIVCGNPYIYVPNAFTPNADNENDVLLVRGQNVSEIYFTIYDRWGEKVFETTDINQGWDGSFNGKKVDPAVFVYYLEAICDDGQQYFEKGNITVIE